MLALACFPGLAQAEESSGIQYETDVPTVPDNTNIPSKKHSGDSNDSDEPSAEASGANPQGGGAGGNGDSNDGGTGAGQGNQAQGGGGGKAGDDARRAGGQVEEAQPIKTVSGVGDEASDGSSPLVPILIAIAALAAISVGAFYYRQRRQGPGSPVSPNAS